MLDTGAQKIYLTLWILFAWMNSLVGQASDPPVLDAEVNPLTGIKELLSNEDMITLALIHKAKTGDVSAYKALDH